MCLGAMQLRTLLEDLTDTFEAFVVTLKTTNIVSLLGLDQISILCTRHTRIWALG